MTAVLDHAAAVDLVVRGRRRRTLRRATTIGVLALLVAGVYAFSLMYGQTFYGPREVYDVLRGETVPGASFTVGELRFPRATLAVLAGAAFGLGGITFQTMLRNPLASPTSSGSARARAPPRWSPSSRSPPARPGSRSWRSSRPWPRPS